MIRYFSENKKSDRFITIWRIPILLLLVAALSAGVYFLLHSPLNGIDDANIFFVYARNLATGKGIVFYPGGEHVEGFTSFLWLLVTSFVFLVAPYKPERWLVVIGIALLACSLPFLIQGIEKTIRRRLLDAPNRLFSGVAVFVCVWTFSAPVFLSWTVLSLMDVGIVSAIFILAAADLLHATRKEPAPAEILRSCAIILLFVLARPEGMVYAAVYGLFRWVFLFLGSQNKPKLRYRLIPAGVYVAVTAAITAFRLAYFGWPFPNTYYAKVSPNLGYNLSQGLIYLRNFLVSSPLASLLLAFILWRSGVFCYDAFTRKAQKTQDVLGEIGVYALVGSGLMVPVLSGGDHFQFFRFYQPIYPLLCTGFIFWMAGFRSIEKSTGLLRNILYILSVIAIFIFTNPNWPSFSSTPAINQEYGIASDFRRIGNELNTAFSHSSSYPIIGEYIVGGLAYTYHGQIFDLVGLNNVEMAHSPGERIGVKNHAAFNKDVFYKHLPDVLVPREIYQTTIPDEYLHCGPSLMQKILKNLECEAAFVQQYKLVIFASTPEKQPPYILAYIRKDKLDEFFSNGVDIITVQNLNSTQPSNP